jgi:copper homeostasis protein
MNVKLEICVDTVESAVYAQDAGAVRVELCSSLPEGGTTPGIGTITSARNNLSIGLHVMIRPRGGDFLYSDTEYDIMRRDIEACGECGVDGIVLGILERDGTIDVERTTRLIELARPMSVTFHRAFDLCSNPEKSLLDIIDTGADRLLTSGQKDKAGEAAEFIRHLIVKAGKKIIIMPGSGLNEANIVHIAKITGASEFHLTARRILVSDMIFRRQNISMGGVAGLTEYSRKVADSDMIKRMIGAMKLI